MYKGSPVCSTTLRVGRTGNKEAFTPPWKAETTTCENCHQLPLGGLDFASQWAWPTQQHVESVLAYMGVFLADIQI